MQPADVRSLALLASLVASSPDAIISSDEHEVITTWNAAAERLFGYTAEEVIGQPFTLLVPPAAEQERRDFLAQVLAGRVAQTVETTRRRKDGSLIAVETTVFTVHDATGKAIGFSSISRDLRERNEREQQFRSLDYRYRMFFERMPGLTYIYEPGLELPNHGTLHLSRQFAELTGYPTRPAAGHLDFVDAIVHPDDRERVRALNRQVEATGAPFVAEYRILAKDGHVLWVRDQANLVAGEAGEPPYWLGFMLDISEQQRAEAALAASEVRFQTVFEDAAIGMAVVTLDLRIRKANHAFCTLLGYTEDELLSKTIQDITYPDDLESDLTEVERTLRGEIETYQIEKRYVRRDGQIVWSYLSVSLVRDELGAPAYFISQIQDIGQRKMAEAAMAQALAQLQGTNQELEQLSAAKSDFVSTISHELRTPLTSIQGYSELIVTDAETLAEAQAFARTINQNAIRLARMIGDVLDLDRMEAGQTPLKLTMVNLNDLVRSVLDELSPTTHRHTLTARLDPKLSVIRCDSDLIIRVITNLVANAIKYAPGGGTVIVATAARPDGVELTVADEGIGIPPDHRETIFDRYSRIARPEQLGIAGTGLGLPIARHIVELHGGAIWTEPNMPVGSIFHVLLPCDGARPDPVAPGE